MYRSVVTKTFQDKIIVLQVEKILLGNKRKYMLKKKSDVQFLTIIAWAHILKMDVCIIFIKGGYI